MKHEGEIVQAETENMCLYQYTCDSCKEVYPFYEMYSDRADKVITCLDCIIKAKAEGRV